MAHGAVIPFHIGVLLRFAGLDIIQPDTLTQSPELQSMTDIFRTIIAANSIGFTLPFIRLLLKRMKPGI